MNNDWPMFTNRFEIATRGNYSIAIAVGTQHQNSLYADSTTSPIALICYNLIKPKVDAYLIAEANLLAQKGTQGGEVSTFKQLENGMGDTVDDWQAQIKTKYPLKTSNKFNVLFPKGKSVFTNGKQQAKIDAVLALLKGIGTDANLTAVKAQIQTFYDGMIATFGTKGGSVADTKNESAALETARLDMCDIIEQNYGKMIDSYHKTPMYPSKYFDEASLRSSLQLIFKNTTKPISNKNILRRTFVNPDSQTVQLSNLTDFGQKFFLSDTANGTVGPVFVLVPANSVVISLLSDLGDPATQPFLNVFNTSAVVSSKCRVRII